MVPPVDGENFGIIPPNCIDNCVRAKGAPLRPIFVNTPTSILFTTLLLSVVEDG